MQNCRLPGGQIVNALEYDPKYHEVTFKGFALPPFLHKKRAGELSTGLSVTSLFFAFFSPFF